MNVSYRWLQAVAPTITETPRELAGRLGMLGAPVDDLVELGAELGDVVIAQVAEVRPHPNADRLRLCTVEAGGDRLQVVCGAPNVEPGRFYPFAPIGATLPGGVSIRKAKLRGEVSEGMLCSSRELGLGRDHEGLMMLAGEWEPGRRLVDELALDDHRLEVDVTPNRPDLMSHVGVARELAQGGGDDIRLDPFGSGARIDISRSADEASIAGVTLRVEDAAGCPRYTAAVIRGVAVGPSPEWLASRLRAVGQRPINNVVDATNYVLQELGQPLHAFDLARLAGPEVRVRAATAGESLRTLDGVERILDTDMLVIADAERPIALAGVMGGEDSEVSDATTDVLIECALFDARSVRRTARRLGLNTEASQRFERGVDPELQPTALARVVDLIVTVAGGQAEPAAADLNPAVWKRHRVELRPTRVARLLGIDISAEEIADLLRPVGFGVGDADAEGPLPVDVPGFRPDVTREVDLIEEVARRRGYDSFPEQMAPFRPGTVPNDEVFAVQERAREVFGQWGFLEARTAPFATEAAARVALLNPLSSEESHLRDELLPGLLRRLEHNWAQGTRDVRLYEIGSVFAPRTDGPNHEELRVAAVFTGARRPPHWAATADAWDIWDLKALIGELSDVITGSSPEAGGTSLAAMDEGRSYRVAGATGEVIGGGGLIQDRAVDAPAWAGEVWGIELALPRAAGRAARAVKSLPEYPAVERDLALVVPRSTAAQQVEGAIRDSAGDQLTGLWPFDLYEGEGIDPAARSIAWRLRFRRDDRTLTDAEVDGFIARILKALERDLSVHRR
jgi:phenylalanyl-tRNA synthetase beta chain